MLQQKSRNAAEKKHVKEKRMAIGEKVARVTAEVEAAGADSPYKPLANVGAALLAPTPPKAKKASGRKRKSNAMIYSEMEWNVERRDVRERPANIRQGFTRIDRTVTETTTRREPFFGNSSSSSSSSCPPPPHPFSQDAQSRVSVINIKLYLNILIV
jgi:hypothetical protein